MTEKSVVYFKGISSLIEAQKFRGVENGAARLMRIPESTVPPLERDFSRARGRNRHYKQTCLQVIKFLCALIINDLRSTPTVRRHAPGQPSYTRDSTFAGAV